MNRYLQRERIENWVGDFGVADAAAAFAPAVREGAAALLCGFLNAACERRGRAPEEVEEEDLKAALLEYAAAQPLAPPLRAQAPELCGAFLEFLAGEGRLAGGREKAAYVRALRTAWRGATGQEDTLARRGRKLDRNGPCPCGSGRKYKKCCWSLG